MRRNLALPAAALIGMASVVPISVAAFSSPRSAPHPVATDDGTPGSIEDRYGLVRYDVTARTWSILSSPAFRSHGLTGVSCSSSTGALTVTFAPLSNIGTFTVDEDDAYAGRFEAGASPATDRLVITFRKPSTGAVVSCNAAEVRIAGSSLQVWVRGARYTPRPSAPQSPTPSPPSSPTKPPAPSPSASPSPSETVDPPEPPTAPPTPRR